MEYSCDDLMKLYVLLFLVGQFHTGFQDVVFPSSMACFYTILLNSVVEVMVL